MDLFEITNINTGKPPIPNHAQLKSDLLKAKKILLHLEGKCQLNLESVRKPCRNSGCILILYCIFLLKPGHSGYLSSRMRSAPDFALGWKKTLDSVPISKKYFSKAIRSWINSLKS